MAKIRKMLDEGSLETELREVMQDDLDDLYGDEDPKSTEGSEKTIAENVREADDD
jgi:hypothetical protein